MPRNGKYGGFTLIEMLIVIAAIGLLMAAILAAVDPILRVRQSRDAQRWAETNAILNAFLNRQVDSLAAYLGEPSAPIRQGSGLYQVIVADDAGIVCNQWANRPGCSVPLDISGPDKACVANLSGLATAHIIALPTDPIGEGENPCGYGSGCAVEGGIGIGPGNSGYYVLVQADGRVEVGACAPEATGEIKSMR